MSSGSCLTSKLYDKIIKMPSKSHDTIPCNLNMKTDVQYNCLQLMQKMTN
jgi:hypothetical protein